MSRCIVFVNVEILLGGYYSSGDKPSGDSGFTKAFSSCQHNQAFGSFVVWILILSITLNKLELYTNNFSKFDEKS